MTEQPPSAWTGRLLGGRYQVHSQLGFGGMGVVLRAYDYRLATEVAIKRVLPELASQPFFRNSLIQEAQLLARLTNNHIVRLFDLAETEEGLFIVLEYVAGPSLQQALGRSQRLSPAETLHVLEQVGAGLMAAHAAGVIHRDLKPSNVLLSLGGDERRAFLDEDQLPANLFGAQAKISDFGIAKLRDLPGPGPGRGTGTPGYIAPEQLRGEAPSPETDIYALGVMAYRMLSGYLPFPPSESSSHREGALPPPFRGCPPALYSVLSRAMAYERDRRYPSAGAFCAALRSAIYEGSVPSARPGWSDRRRLILGSGLLAVAGGMFLLVHNLPKHRTFTDSNPAAHEPANIMMPDEVSAAPDENKIPVAPYIQNLPSIVPEDEGGAVPDSSTLSGPTNGKVRWSVQLPRLLECEIGALERDGTVYLTGGNLLYAIHEGQVRWTRKIAGAWMSQRLKIAPDGRIWMFGDTYCFNSRGEGGKLAGRNPAWSEEGQGIPRSSGEPFRCYTGDNPPAGYGPGPGIARLTANGQPAWFTRLNHDCTDEIFKAGPQGGLSVMTKARTLYRLDANGAIRWTYQVPCNMAETIPLPNDDALLRCKADASTITDLRRITGGRERWVKKPASKWGSAWLTDRRGIAYVV